MFQQKKKKWDLYSMKCGARLLKAIFHKIWPIICVCHVFFYTIYDVKNCNKYSNRISYHFSINFYEVWRIFLDEKVFYCCFVNYCIYIILIEFTIKTDQMGFDFTFKINLPRQFIWQKWSKLKVGFWVLMLNCREIELNLRKFGSW